MYQYKIYINMLHFKSVFIKILQLYRMQYLQNDMGAWSLLSLVLLKVKYEHLF